MSVTDTWPPAPVNVTDTGWGGGGGGLPSPVPPWVVEVVVVFDPGGGWVVVDAGRAAGTTVLGTTIVGVGSRTSVGTVVLVADDVGPPTSCSIGSAMLRCAC